MTAKIYFWHMDYKYPLRDCTPTFRKKVYKAFIKAQLNVEESSDLHKEILYDLIKKIKHVKKAYIKVWKGQKMTDNELNMNTLRDAIHDCREIMAETLLIGEKMASVLTEFSEQIAEIGSAF